MNELPEEIERVLLQITPEDRKKAKDDEIARGGEKGVSLNSRAAIYSLDRQLKSSLAANREQKATLADRDNHIDLAYKALGDVNRSVYLFDHIREQKAEIERLTEQLNTASSACEEGSEIVGELASVGEKWIDVKHELPPANKNHCWLAWITSQNKNGGYIDLVSYGEYICFNEECHDGDENYVEHDDGNMKRFGWYREEETHGGEFDYIFVDLNGKVTRWQPLPAPPTLPGEEK